MTKTQRSVALIALAIVVAGGLIWALWPARMAEVPAGATDAVMEGAPGDEKPATLDAPLNPQTDADIVATDEPLPLDGAKLPAPNSAELTRLHEEALAGNRESLEELCRYIQGSDLYDMGDFKPSEEMTASCGEFRVEEPEE
jgi:hypothetical protein